MKCRLLLSFVLGFFLVGCNGARVVDNVYGAGNRQYVVSKDLSYMGEAPRTTNNKCVGLYCARTYGKTSSRSLSDMFIKANGKKTEEAVILTKIRAAKGFYFNGFNGDSFVLGGMDFIELFLKVDKNDSAPYKAYAGDSGCDVSDEDFLVIGLVRNTSRTTRMVISYACAVGMIPDDVLGNADKEKAFLRERVRSRVTVR